MCGLFSPTCFRMEYRCNFFCAFFQFIVRGWIVINGSLHAIHKITVKMGREMIAVGATRTNNRNMEIFPCLEIK